LITVNKDITDAHTVATFVFWGSNEIFPAPLINGEEMVKGVLKHIPHTIQALKDMQRFFSLCFEKGGASLHTQALLRLPKA
jgi:hypothetical protein